MEKFKTNNIKDLFPVSKEYQLLNYNALFLKGKDLKRENRIFLQTIITDILKANYPGLSDLEYQVLRFYYDVDNFHPRESQYTDWTIIFNKLGIPLAITSIYSGGVERRKKIDPDTDASPRFFYLGDENAILEHILFTANEYFMVEQDFAFVVDPNQVDINRIDKTLRIISSQINKRVHLYIQKGSRLPFVDEERRWLTRDKLRYKRTDLPSEFQSRRVTDRKYFDPIKKFLKIFHPFNSFAEETLEEGIAYVIEKQTNGNRNGNSIVNTAVLSYPTILPDGTHIIAATDLATDFKFRRSGLATYNRFNTLFDLYYQSENNGGGFFQEDEDWQNALVVVDNPVISGEEAIALNDNLGYTQLKIGGTPFVRRWLTAGVRYKKALAHLRD